MTQVDDVSTGSPRRRYTPGTEVEVRNAYDRSWTSGFEVIDHTEEGYSLLRLSDGQPLPVAMPAASVRRRKRKQGMWWA